MHTDLRRKAIDWFRNKLTPSQRDTLSEEVYGRKYYTLTGREIEELYMATCSVLRLPIFKVKTALIGYTTETGDTLKIGMATLFYDEERSQANRTEHIYLN